MSDHTAQRVQSFFETLAAKNAAGDVVGQAHRDQKAATDSRHRRVVADDLAVVQQASEVALHLVAFGRSGV